MPEIAQCNKITQCVRIPQGIKILQCIKIGQTNFLYLDRAHPKIFGTVKFFNAVRLGARDSPLFADFPMCFSIVL